MEGTKGNWAIKDLSYYFLKWDKEDMSYEDWCSEWVAGFESWSDVCDLNFSRTRELHSANIIISCNADKKHGFGEKAGTLARAQFPEKDYSGSVLIWTDVYEDWIVRASNEEGIILQAVAAHEIGHALGLKHSKNKGSLMYPRYNPSIIKPQEEDIARIETLYKSTGV
tara:strand:- start:2288 stop:2791 length:504 start_codon:yes stop_codon:yes gene_type:complete